MIEDVIRDSGQIRGARTREEAQDLAVNLRSGALPAAIEVVQERTVEASLGADSIRHGLQAGAVGLAAVVATMLLYYRWAGANATLALLLNGVLLIAALACFGAVLTLPGIAGVVLTIGMAVDSNVLIFERIREELRSGQVGRGGAGGRILEGLRHAGGYARDHGGLVRLSVLLRNSRGKGLRRHAGDRTDHQPVHVRIRVAGGLRVIADDLEPQTRVIEIVFPSILKSFMVHSPPLVTAFSVASRSAFTGMLAISTMAGV